MRLTVEWAAKFAHEINRAYCASIGDLSQNSWEESPGWQQESAKLGVAAHRASPELTPEQSHEAWYAHKAKEGWKWGPVKNPSLLEHPCMLPYDQLPKEQRVKDHLFKAVCRLTHNLPQNAIATEQSVLAEIHGNTVG